MFNKESKMVLGVDKMPASPILIYVAVPVYLTIASLMAASWLIKKFSKEIKHA